MSGRRLDWLLRDSATRTPEAEAVRAGGNTGDTVEGSVSYRALDQLANQLASELAGLGVQRGDRVGIWLSKSPVAIAAMQATLRLGAAYVPVDPQSSGIRAASILSDCSVAAIVTTVDRVGLVKGSEVDQTKVLTVDEARSGPSPREADEGELTTFSSEGPADELAYILYTSGSTGKPKGVEISHRNALAFIDWAVDFVGATASDRFSNHAPFHFDLSVLDLYAAFSVGASVHIVPPALSYAPKQLLEFITSAEITIWYSVPSALIMMLDHTNMLELPSLPLRHLLFAGEPFPIAKLRAIWQKWPELPMHNLFGPTETNVCTAFTVTTIEDDRTKPVPIGSATCGDKVWAITKAGARAEVGEEGELYVEGPTVMLGYHGHPPQGERPYPTGDIVRRIDEENFEYIGRRDQMLKVRGHRIEAGEVEACLLLHTDVREAAVVVHGSGIEARLVAYLVAKEDKRPSIIALKQHCAARLSRSMVIDKARWLDELPRTRNGKIDRRSLAAEG